MNTDQPLTYACHLDRRELAMLRGIKPGDLLREPLAMIAKHVGGALDNMPATHPLVMEIRVERDFRHPELIRWRSTFWLSDRADIETASTAFHRLSSENAELWEANRSIRAAATCDAVLARRRIARLLRTRVRFRARRRPRMGIRPR